MGTVYLTGAKFPLPDACGAGDPSFRYPTRVALPPRIHVPTRVHVLSISQL
jgi:hypothetical protein